MKKIFVAIAILLIVTNITIAQDVQVNGKTFQTVKKTVLNSETGFYQLKEKGKIGAKQESYIKTGNQFHKTVFTETELKNFIQTGNVSSLGKIEREKITDSTGIKYLNKGSKKVFFTAKKNLLTVYEYTVKANDISIKAKLSNDEDQGPQETDEWKECVSGCFQIEDECKEEFGPQPEYPDHNVCNDDWTDCYTRCNTVFSRGGKGGNLVKYIITVNAVKITR